MLGKKRSQDFNYKFEHHWGGEDTWYTKGKRWANKQKFPINHLALGFIEWLWEHWVDGKVQMTMTTVDQQANAILDEWDEQEKKRPTILSRESEVEGLPELRISSPYRPRESYDFPLDTREWYQGPLEVFEETEEGTDDGETDSTV